MAIDAITQAAASGISGAAGVSQSMGKDAFLKLLVTQLQNQDPLSPADSTEFTAQLAQFSSLEQLNNINQNLETLNLFQSSINNAQAVSLIGKEVLARGNALEKRDNLPLDCEFDLESNASRVVVSIYDATGGFVTDLVGATLPAGRHSLVWDGRDRNGSPAADGIYSFEIQAEGVDGTKVAASSLIRGQVKGVSLDGSTPLLMIGERRVAFGSVLQVSTPPAATDNG